jgi:hypothetical protein
MRYYAIWDENYNFVEVKWLDPTKTEDWITSDGNPIVGAQSVDEENLPVSGSIFNPLTCEFELPQ